MQQTADMRLSDRLLLRGLRPHLSEGASILAMERGTSDALGPMRKVRAVLTDDALLLATPVRSRTILTVVPRHDIVSVTPAERGAVAACCTGCAFPFACFFGCSSAARANGAAASSAIIITSNRFIISLRSS